MVIANLSSTISLQFPVLLFSVVWSRSSLFCSCLLAGAPPSVAPLSGCLQEQRRDVTLRPSPIRLVPSSSSKIHFMMEIYPICVQQHLCTPHVDHRAVFLTDFLRRACSFPSWEQERSVQVERWCMRAEYRLMLITRCWNIIQSGAWRHLRHARRLRSSDMVITAICVHLMLSVFQLQSSRLLWCTKLCRWREEQYKYIWWFQILDGKKKPSIYFGLCLVCVNGSRVLSNVEGGMGWQQRRADTWYRDSEPSTIHPMSPFCQHHRQKFVLERTGQQLLKTLLRQEFQF